MATAQTNGRSYDSEFVGQLRAMQDSHTQVLFENELAMNELTDRREHRKAIMTAFELTMLALQKIDSRIAAVKVRKLPE